jgi:hypothetical protein
MRVIHRVRDKFTTRSRQAHDTFTTKNRSQWIGFNFVSFATRSLLVHDRFLLTTCSRQVHDKIKHRELVVNALWSRLCCRRFGQSTSRMPSCDFYAVRRHPHVILQAKIVSWRRNKADSVGELFFWWIIFNVTSLPHDSFATRSRQLSTTNEA